MTTYAFPLAFFAAIGAYVFAETPAFGILGESASTIAQDQGALKATQRAQSQGGYTIHILEAGGATIREYTAPNGVVFAVSWNHQTGLLNLQQLFGAYYEEFSQAIGMQPRQSERFHRISTEHLVVERGGRMGAAWGSAWSVGLCQRSGERPNYHDVQRDDLAKLPRYGL